MGTRLLKVEEHYYRTAWEERKASRIRLKGKWLEKAGFRFGDYAKVEVKPGQLIITRQEA